MWGGGVRHRRSHRESRRPRQRRRKKLFFGFEPTVTHQRVYKRPSPALHTLNSAMCAEIEKKGGREGEVRARQ